MVDATADDFYPLGPFYVTDKEFDNLLTMTFETYMISPWTNMMEDTCRHPVEIPICIGGTMVILREKHEGELLRGESFLEKEAPPESTVRKFSEMLLRDCDSFEECRAFLCPQPAVTIFHVLIDIFKRMENAIFPISVRTAKVVEKLVLMEPVHPYDFKLADVLYKESMAFCTDTGGKGHTDKKVKQPDNIVDFLNTFYNCTYVGKQQKWRLVNVFNKRIFHDLHLIESNLRRNTIRFVIKNLLHISRRYVIANLINLRRKRDETWTLNTITTLPHVTEFVMKTIATQIAPYFFRFHPTICLQSDLAIRLMINIFCANTDRAWMPKQPLNAILINMEPSLCHERCVCGQGEVGGQHPLAKVSHL
ncbi:unnamed protein product [Schistocephalus solidus]|uniref:NR LBD domain-containing protein n=1 Tax=Schistocephalus solidus TaxID=70667 RepID=A0A0X3NP48_SCHSO|nr:unnamed protein product [Schistocephalus solidus]